MARAAGREIVGWERASRVPFDAVIAAAAEELLRRFVQLIGIAEACPRPSIPIRRASGTADRA